MRIVIDMQGAQSASRFRGIGRYSLSLALAMARNSRGHEIWLALNGAFPESIDSIRYAFEGLVPTERIRIFEVPNPVAEVEQGNSWRMRAAEKIREKFLLEMKPDVVHVSSLFEGYVDDAVTSVGSFTSGLCTVVTLYDLIPLLNQREYLIDDAQRDYYLRKVQCLKKADLLFAISEASRLEAIDALQLSDTRSIDISAAVDNQFHPLNLISKRIWQLKNRYGIERKIVMYAPGGFDIRKNFEGLMNAYAMLSATLRADHQLVIVGDIDADLDARGRLHKLAEQAGVAENELIITGYIPNEELVELYNMATLFVYPSKHEGFGLPVLEAMACGTPVIGSNLTSIPEVIGLQEALFDPSSAPDFSKKMVQALSDESFRDRLSVHGLNQAKRFTWDECARRAITALETLVQANGTNLIQEGTQETLPELIPSIAVINDRLKPTEADLVRVAECIAFNTKRGSNKQLLLDVSVIVHGDAKSGIQRVVRSLLSELVENSPSDTDVRLIYFDCIDYKYASIFTAEISGELSHKATMYFDDTRYKYERTFTTAASGGPIREVIDEIVDFCQDDIYLALDLNAHLTAAVSALHMRLQRRGIKFYFIVYDILLVQHPQWWPEGTSVIFEAWLRNISKVATGLICISEAVADEVRAWLIQNPPQRISGLVVSSFHLGADVENSLPNKGLPDDAETTLAALHATPSFLMVGTLEPRKGHAQTLAAFELLWKQGINANLVIVGKRGWLVNRLIDNLASHSEINQHLFWLEGISDEYLESIYAVSTCLIAASEGEGFGLPLIEAAQHKIPIIARDIPVFREVAGEHATYFSGFESNDIADTIRNWLALYRKNSHLKSDNMHYLSWRESAMQLRKQLNLT